LKNKHVIALSILFGLLTAYLIYDYLTKVERSMNNVQYGEVVMAAADIPAQTLVTGEMLQVKKVAAEYIHPLAARKKEEVIGRITVAPVAAGEQVLKKRLAGPSEAKHGLSYLIPAGKRAVTVAVDDVSGISGLIRPGDRVDVAATVSIPGEREQKEIPYTLVILQDLQVLAVGKTLEDKSEGQTPLEYKTVTLAVTVEQSQPLVLASQRGSIRLMLRSPVDSSLVDTAPYRAEHFLTR
jgi:pilus assembly protein CpaB